MTQLETADIAEVMKLMEYVECKYSLTGTVRQTENYFKQLRIL
jgi:hypothetical protein